MFKESLMPEGGAEIMGAYSHGLKVYLGNSEMIFQQCLQLEINILQLVSL